MNEQKQSTALEGRRMEEAIRREAYCLWKLDGCQDGRELEYWLEAKKIIQRRVDEDLGPPPTLAKICIEQRTSDESFLAPGQPKSPSVATATPAALRPRGKVSAEMLPAVAD